MRRAPEQVHKAAAARLADAPEHVRQTVALRVDRWWQDLRDGLAAAYADPDGLGVRLVELAADCVRDRDPELARLDEARTLEPDWLQSPHQLGYAAYADRFAGDLAGVREKVPYLRELGVTYLHLMPLLTSREGDDDGGYAVSDYRSIRPALGTLDDLRELGRDLRAHGISLVLDLVLNHVAYEHEWARQARAGSVRHRGYFHVYADRESPDAYEQTLPDTFPATSPGNFTWDEDLSGWVWTTFNTFQWDVNWSNPEVLVEYAEVVLFLAGLGAEVLRLDAIAFLWKRPGTTSQNQPEVHAITQALRALTKIACPALAFKAEAIVGPGDLVHYLGRGVHAGKVSDLAYHNSLMVQAWSMTAAQDAVLGATALRALPPAPSSTAWITYLRCHDDIGWAVDDADAWAAGVSGFMHRGFLSDWYSGRFPGSTARGLVFQENPDTHDRRISGTAATLCGIEAALAGPGPGSADLDLAVDRLLLLHALVLGWGGIPVLWSGDELALRDDPDWAAEPGHAGDNRWAHRPRLPWDVAERRHDPATLEGRVFGGLKHLAAVRASLPHLHAATAAEVLDLADPAVLPVLRRHPVGPMLGLYNVAPTPRAWYVDTVRYLGLERPYDALTGRDLHGPVVELEPYGVRWLVDRR